jgi:hypothetical protein
MPGYHNISVIFFATAKLSINSGFYVVKQKHIFYFLLSTVAVAALILYNPWVLYFQNDDMVHIPLSRDGIFLQHNSFRPVCDISMMMDYKLWGKRAYGYHFTNLMLHAINSILVFILSKNLLLKYSENRAADIYVLTVSVLFWIYMNHSEAVFWILGRSAMLGMVFFLPACIFYLKRGSPLYFICSILFCLLSWLSYESAFILPLLFLVISYTDVSKGISSWKKEIQKLLVVAVSFIVYLYTRFYFTGTLSTEYQSGTLNSSGILTLVVNFLKLAVRSWLPPSQNSAVLVGTFILLIAVIGLFTLRLKDAKQKKLVAVLVLIWLISLLPYITLSVDTKGLESERFIYMPSFFVCLIIVTIIFQFNLFWRTGLITIFCCINILVLVAHANQYQFAGTVVKTTINAVNALYNKQKLFAENIPQENFGALIFRSGFNEGIDWLKNKGTVDSVVQVSQSNKDLILQKKYSVKHSSDISLIKDSTVRNQFLSNDVFFLYTDSLLYVIQRAE